MTIPADVIERLKLFCEESNLGMVVIGNSETNVHAIIMGDRSYGPNEASILMVQTLVNGIVADVYSSMNAQALAEKEFNDNKKPN